MNSMIIWAIDAFIKRFVLLIIVLIAVEYLAKKNSRTVIKYPTTAWDTASIYRVLFLFLIIEYALPFVLGGVFYNDFSAFLVPIPAWKDELVGLLFVSTILVTILYIVVYKYRLPLTVLGLRRDRWKFGLVWGLGFVLAFEALFVYFKRYVNTTAMPCDDIQANYLWLLPVIIIGPIAEEVFYRGYVYPNLRNKIGILWAVLLSSACFVILHQAWDDWMSIFMFGILLCYVYEKSGSLIAPIIGHIAKNTFAITLDCRYGAIVDKVPWAVIWGILIITGTLYFIIIRKTPLSIRKKKGAYNNSIISEYHECRDTQRIVNVATRRGRMVAILLGVILILLYIFAK